MSETVIGKIGSRDWADHKIRNVIPSKAPNQINPVRPQVSTAIPKGISGGVSTITSMAQVEERAKYVPLRPVLKDPVVELQDGELMAMRQCLDQASIIIAESDMPNDMKEGYLRLIAKMQISIEEIAGKYLDHIGKQSKIDSKELDELNLKKTEEIKKAILAEKDVESWAEFTNIMRFFLGGVTIVLGSVLVATGVAAVAGAFLIASGGLGLLDKIATDTKAYQSIISYFTKSREMQDKIAGYINTSVLLATLGMGLYGGIMNNIGAGLDLARGTITAIDASRKIEVAIGIASAGANTTKAWKENSMADIRKTLMLIEGRIFFMKEEMRRKTSEAKSTISMMQVITKSAKQAVAAAG